MINLKVNKSSLIIFFLSIFSFGLVFIRLFPVTYGLGYDFISTKDQFPNEIASGYGLWFLLALLSKTSGLGFNFFWIAISLLFAWSVCSFYSVAKIKEDYLGRIVLVLFLVGYALPWYGYAHVRYGTSILFILSASFKTDKKKYLYFFLALSLHSISILFIFIIYATKYLKGRFIFLPILSGLFLIIYSKELIIKFFLNILLYSNYLGDFYQFSFSSSNFLMLIRAVLLLAAMLNITYPKSQNRNILLSLNTIYLLSIFLTPFSGRIIEFLYPATIVFYEKKNKIMLFILFLIFLIEAYFSLIKVILHHEI